MANQFTACILLPISQSILKHIPEAEAHGCRKALGYTVNVVVRSIHRRGYYTRHKLNSSSAIFYSKHKVSVAIIIYFQISTHFLIASPPTGHSRSSLPNGRRCVSIGSFASTSFVTINCSSSVYWSIVQPRIHPDVFLFCFLKKSEHKYIDKYINSGFFDSGSVEAPCFISSSSLPPRLFPSFFLFHCSSYKYAEMKYTLLLVVNDVLWYSLSLWIVLCLLCMMYSY